MHRDRGAGDIEQDVHAVFAAVRAPEAAGEPGERESPATGNPERDMAARGHHVRARYDGAGGDWSQTVALVPPGFIGTAPLKTASGMLATYSTYSFVGFTVSHRTVMYASAGEKI